MDGFGNLKNEVVSTTLLVVVGVVCERAVSMVCGVRERVRVHAMCQ